MKKIVTFLFFLFLSTTFFLSAQTTLKAGFSAEETLVLTYKQGFDSPTEMQEWSVNAVNVNRTWGLGNSKKQGLPSFNTINPTSLYSAAIFYDDNTYQNEKLISPYYTLNKTTICRLYTAFDGGMLIFANFTISVEKESNNAVKEIFNAFNWAQESGHERHKWLMFEFDLSEFTGENVRFIFEYKGINGDDVYIDDFCLYEIDKSDNAKAFIKEGEQVHFEDTSEGSPTAWEWTFEGGTPATSDEPNPVITYNKAGSYEVKLKITKDGESDEIVKTGFVNVEGVAPAAAFDFPEEGYMSPEAAIYVPLNFPVTYTDKSANIPTEWLWTFTGTYVSSSTDQNPVVTYPEEGLYNVSLQVTNAQGTDKSNFEQAVQAGGSCHIWNLSMEESQEIGGISAGWYGYYGGSNWLGMVAFAEGFKKPVVKSEISAVDVYFYKTTTIEPPVDITVSVASDKDGLPGEKLISKTLSSTELVYDPSNWVPTTFTFTQPVEIEDVFYIIVDGIPNRTDEISYESDEVVIGAVRRGNDAIRPTTSYHLLEEWDNNDNPTGKTEWFKNTDENVSFGITPLLTYLNTETDIQPVDEMKPLLSVINKTLTVTGLESPCDIVIYNMQGIVAASFKQVQHSVNLTIDSGVYIVKVIEGKKQHTYKIIL